MMSYYQYQSVTNGVQAIFFLLKVVYVIIKNVSDHPKVWFQVYNSACRSCQLP